MVKLATVPVILLLVSGLAVAHTMQRSAAEWLLMFDSPDGADQARANLLVLGDDAVDSIVEAIDIARSPIRAAVLMSILEAINTPKATEALMRLLGHRNSVVRAIAATFVGSLKMKCAIPWLLPLLGDFAYAGETVEIHSGKTDTRTVADVVAEVLTTVSGVRLAPLKTADLRRAAIEAWWRDDPSSSQCR